MANAMKVWAMNVSTKTVFVGWRLPALAFGATLGVLATSPAWAQGMGMGGGSPVSSVGRSNRAAASQDKPPEPAPDAIPGATPRSPAAPAGKTVGDLQPTDALFDAINRGDIAAARDALNRGADLDGVNILGMTPMELSVDLSRNDISFLLLSMRGEDSGRGSRAVGRDTPVFATSGKTAQAGKSAQAGKNVQAGKNGRSGRSTVAGKAVPAKTASMANRPAAARPDATPKEFANDGGTPLPSAGFLGFDSRSASN
jgi:hypothetical protein